MATAGVREFVSQVLELAIGDSAEAWSTIAVVSDNAVTARPDAGAVEVTVAAASAQPAYVRAAIGAAAVVVGSADGMLRQHIRQLRTQLAVSPGAASVTDAVAAQIARAASDIDAAKLQITELPSTRDDLNSVVGPCRQAVARARAAADHLLEHSRHALDASNPATQRWRDVEAGSRLAVRLLDALGAPLG